MNIDADTAYKIGQLAAISSSIRSSKDNDPEFCKKLAFKLKKELFPEAEGVSYNKFIKTSEILSRNRFSAAAKMRLKKAYGGL